MKKFSLISAGSALVLALGVSLPAAAQMTYNFADGGNCNFPPATCTVVGSSTVASNLSLEGWAAASGANFAASTITNQGASGIGMSFTGETTGSPQHAIDNETQTELVLLNFGTNKVVLTGLSVGWGYNDTDIAVLRWTGSSAPDMSTTKVTDSVTGLVAKGWSIVASADLDGPSAAGSTFGALSASNLVTVNSANSSSWWIVSSYFGGGSIGAADSLYDYFKLQSVTATCVSNTAGGACNTIPPSAPGVPEPATLALAALALAGIGYSRRKNAK